MINKSTILTTAIAALCYLNPLSCEAQKRVKKYDNPFKHSRRIEERIPIHGSATHGVKFYGVRAGIDYPLSILETRNFNRFRAGRLYKERYLTADIGAWHYDGINENIFVNFEFTMRRTNENGFFVQFTPIGTGLNYTIKPIFQLYKRKAFEIDSIPANRFFVSPSMSVGIGKDFGVKMRGWGVPVTILAKFGITSMNPYKKFGYIFPVAEFSLGYRFERFTTYVRKTVKN